MRWWGKRIEGKKLKRRREQRKWEEKLGRGSVWVSHDGWLNESLLALCWLVYDRIKLSLSYWRVLIWFCKEENRVGLVLLNESRCHQCWSSYKAYFGWTQSCGTLLKLKLYEILLCAMFRFDNILYWCLSVHPGWRENYNMMFYC